MSSLRNLVRAVVGLLIDDAALAVAIVSVVATCLAASLLGMPAAFICALLPLALVLVLVENVSRACRNHRNQGPARNGTGAGSQQ